MLGSEFRLPFGELFGGDLAGLFRINLRKPSFERLSELGRGLPKGIASSSDERPTYSSVCALSLWVPKLLSESETHWKQVEGLEEGGGTDLADAVDRDALRRLLPLGLFL